MPEIPAPERNKIVQPHVLVKNVSAQDFAITEIGGYVLHAGDEIDMLDDELPKHYGDYRAVLRAINELDRTSLYAGVHSGPPKLSYRIANVW